MTNAEKRAGLLEEGAKAKRALERVVNGIIEKQTGACFRVYKAQLLSAPAESTDGRCTVQFIGETDTTVSVRFANTAKYIPAGTLVWVAVIDNNFSTAFVWERYDFNAPNSYSEPPATSDADGNKGDVAFDENFMYICTEQNTWKRVALEAF